MDSYSVIVLIFGILIFIILSLLFFLNRLLFLKNKVEAKFLPIKTHLEERMSLIDEMIQFISKNLKHEEVYVKKLEKAKETIQEISSAKNGIKGLKETEKVVLDFCSLENVYNELKDKKEYTILKNKILANQNRILYSLEQYDKGVRNYSNYQERKIISVLSMLFRFPIYDYYKN